MRTFYFAPSDSWGSAVISGHVDNIEKDRKLLRLITCTGNWLKQLRTHDKRLVVSAILKQ